MKSLKSQNYYEILGVSRQASPDEIRSAYEIARHTFQENSLATYSLFTAQENEEILALMTRAFDTLFNAEARRSYDSDLLEPELSRAAPERRPLVAPGLVESPPGRPRPEREGLSEPAKSEVPETPRAEGPAAPSVEAPRPGPVPWARLFSSHSGQASTALPPAEDVPGVERAAAPVKPIAPAAAKPKEEPGGPVSAYTGPVLKRARLQANLSLEQMAERTKIRRTYLEYIEEENFQFLPAAVYVKGFVSILAMTLGLPPQRVADDYMANYKSKRA